MKHKAPCSSRDYSGVRESGPRKTDEDGDDGGDVDEDDHRGDDSPPDGTPPSPSAWRSPAEIIVAVIVFINITIIITILISFTRSTLPHPAVIPT